MKQILFIFSLSLLFAACQHSSGDFYRAIDTSVSNAEILVSEHDASVLWAMENNRPDTIVPITRMTLAQIVKELDNIQLQQVPENAERMKSAAEGYIESLMNFVKTQSNYADFSLMATEEETLMMDMKNIQALTAVSVSRKKYDEFLGALGKDKAFN